MPTMQLLMIEDSVCLLSAKLADANLVSTNFVQSSQRSDIPVIPPYYCQPGIVLVSSIIV